MMAKKFHWLYRETAYNSWCYSVITQAGNFYRTRIVCRGVNYVKRKPLMFAYPNEKLTSYILERWPKKYVYIHMRIYVRVRVRTKTEIRRACHNPVRFFSPFDILRDLRISARHSLLNLVLLVAILYQVQIPEPSMSLIVSLIHY